MQQVSKYLVIGSGRMATHFCYYLQLLNLPWQQWSRKNNTVTELIEYNKTCSHVLLLINDHAIEPFINANSFLLTKCCIHFSGKLVVQNVFSTHPLMTFSHNLYNLDTYRSIPFILEQEGPNLIELLPELPNCEYKIPRSSKSLYHALIAMGNNFTTLLWQHVFQSLQDDLHLQPEIVYPILKQTITNLLQQPQDALTGPLIRGDQDTITAHLAALENNLYKEVYKAFITVFQKAQNKS